MRGVRWGAGGLLAIAALLGLLACGPAESRPEPATLPALEGADAEGAESAATVGAVTVDAPTPSLLSSDTAPSNPTIIRELPARTEELLELGAEEAEAAEQRFERVLRAEWATDFSRTIIDFDEIMTGGPPKDGIPSIDAPQFEPIGEADEWLDDLEPVQVVDINGEVRAYPVQVMVWHELVNDVVGGEPVVITF